MAKPRRTISPDYIQSKLKQGWTTADFCADLEISEEDLSDFCRRHSNNPHYAQFFANVKKNEQLAKKRQRAEDKKNSIVTQQEESPMPKVAILEPIQVKANNEEVTQPKIIEEKPEDAKIRSLRSDIEKSESELSSMLSLKEKLSKEIVELTSRSQKLKDDCENLRKELGNKTHQLQNASDRIVVLKNHSMQNDKNIDEAKKKISDLQHDIRELQKISITVHTNGEISIDKDVQIPASWENVYSKLINDSIVDNITIKQIRQLAKIISLNEKLYQDKEYFQFIFEYDSSGRDSIKTLFELLTENNS